VGTVGGRKDTFRCPVLATARSSGLAFLHRLPMETPLSLKIAQSADLDVPLPPLDRDLVRDDDLRILAVAVLRRGLRDARKAPRAALDELERGGWDLWLALVRLDRGVVRPHLETLVARVPVDQPLARYERGAFFGERRFGAPRTPSQRGWRPQLAPRTAADWRALVQRAGPSLARLAGLVGLDETATRAELRDTGLLRRHERFGAFYERLELEDMLASVAAE
jgi:hypothetical protein